MGPMKVGGIALASAIASTVNLLALTYKMSKKLNGIWDKGRDYMVRITLAAVLSGGVSFALWNMWPSFHELVRLSASVALGFLAYGIFSYALGIQQARKVVDSISRRLSRT
jgi:peptidoglycan biosynthesis protein MviN/MurJ (putative lipid II flippase)